MTRSKGRRKRGKYRATRGLLKAMAMSQRISGRDVGLEESWYQGRPVVLGHRGGMATGPENTLYTFKQAMALGADGIELDVRRSRDAVAVVIHDRLLDRTTSQWGNVHDYTAAELTTINAGWTHPQAGHQGVVRLEEVLAALPDGTICNVELKPTYKLPGILERAVITAIQKEKVRLRILVSCFLTFSLMRIRSLAPEVKVAYLCEHKGVITNQIALGTPTIRPDAMHYGRKMVSERLVRQTHAVGMRVHVWTVNDPEEARRLLDWGVDGLITDDVATVKAVRDAWVEARVADLQED
jgi:glycerophosphoryl diester phosphodiesterase